MLGNFCMLFLNQKIQNAYPCLMLLVANKDVIGVESFKSTKVRSNLIKFTLLELVFYDDLVLKFKTMLKSLIKKIIKRYKKTLYITWKSYGSLHLCLSTHSRVIAIVSSLIARLWVRPQTQ